MVTKKQKSQLGTEEESKATEQKSQLPTEEENDSTKSMSVVFTFDKLLEFLEMLYNNIWVQLDLLVKCFLKFRNIELYSKYKIVVFIIFLVLHLCIWSE